jgi:hypothetical protein
MSTITLHGMATRKNEAKGSEKKRKGISLRVDADLLDRIDRFCESQPIPVDRTAFLETAARRFLEAMEREQAAD